MTNSKLDVLKLASMFPVHIWFGASAHGCFKIIPENKQIAEYMQTSNQTK